MKQITLAALAAFVLSAAAHASSHAAQQIARQCETQASQARATSAEAARKMCELGAHDAQQAHGAEICARSMASYARELPTQRGHDHDVYTENAAAYQAGCDTVRRLKKGSQ